MKTCHLTFTVFMTTKVPNILKNIVKNQNCLILTARNTPAYHLFHHFKVIAFSFSEEALGKYTFRETFRS